MAFPVGWTKRHALEISATPFNSDVTNFPYCVKNGHLNAGILTAAQSSGADVRFSLDIDGYIPLNHEIEVFDQGTPQIVIWVKVPYISSTAGQTIYCWYGNASASAPDADDADHGSRGVWADYNGAWHGGDVSGDSTKIKDSTVNADHAAKSAGPVESSSGKIYKGQQFTNDYADSAGATKTLTDPFTFSFWVKRTDIAESSNYVDMMDSGRSQFATLFMYTNDKWRFYVKGNALINEESTSAYNDTDWHYVAGVYDVANDEIGVYVDGDYDSMENTLTSLNIDVSSGRLRWGARSSDGAQDIDDALLSEMRLCSLARSVDWLDAEKDTHADTSTYITAGDEETLPYDYTADQVKRPFWFLILELDQCAESYGVAPCTASGDTGSCYYNWPHCQDVANYNQGLYEWRFCSRYARIPAAKDLDGDGTVMPLLLDPSKFITTKINTEKFKTERGELRLELVNDAARALANPNKGAYSASDSGRFWPAFLARYENFKGRYAYIYRGYDGQPVWDMDLKFKGVIEDLYLTARGVEVRVLDLLWKLADAKAVQKLSSSNTLNEDLTAVETAIDVVDADELKDATANEPQTIQINDELIIYTGKSGDTLTPCTRGAFGTTAATHSTGDKIKQALVYAEDNGTWANCTRLPHDHVFMDLLCKWGGIDPSFIKTVDVGTDINGAINDSVTTITVDDASNMPDAGIIKIDSEFIRYGAKSGNDLTSCKRAMYGTTAAAHNDNADVYYSTFTDQLGFWCQSNTYKFRSVKSQAVKDRIQQMALATLCDVFQNEAGEIECRSQRPLLGSESAAEFTEADMVDGVRDVDWNEDSRVTRTYLYYDGNKIDPGKSDDDDDDWDGRELYIDTDAEDARSFGEEIEKVFHGEFIANSTEANYLTAKYFMRHRKALPRVSFELELKNDDVKVGDIIKLTIPDIVDQAGTAAARYYRVIQKTWINANRIKLLVEDGGFSGRKYFILAPNTVTADYDSATDEQKATYGWLADSNGKLGANDDDAYYLW